MSADDAKLGATLPAEEDAAPAPAPSLDRWERYEILGELGRGGMGTVYRARDRQLGRVVALKFLLGAHPNMALRFLQEARAQARIDHPNICRVYEVGDYGGRSYIAMQFVDGEELGRAAATMSLDEKVAVLREVAAAMNEAHRLGIVHRDLKPSNIVVTRADDRRFVPVVMDFGLAREATSDPGLTESGALLGTPAYMAPEQARGEARNVDRRADVYSLGATFYCMLTGRPPFAQPSTALVLNALLHEEPPRPRALVPSLPVDLETIVLHCLDKEPERRYPSARALADDLSRYLDGEPIRGRRASWWRRLGRRARKQRALVAVSLASLVAVTVTAGFGVLARVRAGERVRLAESLGQDAKEIEWLLRAAYQLPLHDTTPEKEAVKERMRRIAATPHDLGALGDATIHDALGRGYLALHDWPRADAELARAAAAGLDTASLHLARGRVLGELYHRAVDDARRSGDPAWRARREKEIERRYLEPARAEIERGRGAVAATADAALLEALVALYRRDYAEAERRAVAASQRVPWLYEARKVAGDAAYAAAVDKVDHGGYDAARADLDRANRLYLEAAEVARSDTSIHEAAAQALRERAEVDWRQGQTPADTLEAAAAAAGRAIAADARSAPAYTTLAYVLMLRYRIPALRARDQAELIASLASAAERAVAIDPQNTRAWDALGDAELFGGIYERQRGGDPSPRWERALLAIGNALRLEPNDPWANNDLGVVHRRRGALLEDSGRDPEAEYRAAIASYERAAHIDPEYIEAIANLVSVNVAVAEHRLGRGLDPSEAVARAVAAGDRCLALDGSYNSALNNLATAHLAEARYLVAVARDPKAPIAAARAALARWLRVQPHHMVAHYLSALASIEEARFALGAGGDATAPLARARAEIAEALRLDAASPDAHVAAAELELLQATAAASKSSATVAPLERALTAAKRAVALDGHYADAASVAAKACWRLAGARAGQSALPSVREGLAFADRAIALNGQLAEAYAVRAALLSRRAALLRDASARTEADAAAARAFQINSLLRREWEDAIAR